VKEPCVEREDKSLGMCLFFDPAPLSRQRGSASIVSTLKWHKKKLGVP